MNSCDQLYSPMDSISSGHLTLGVYPMFIAIGQLFFDKILFYPENLYIKIYVDDFLEFANLFLKISQLLFNETESENVSFASINLWQVSKKNNEFVCIFQNQSNYSISFDLFQLTELYEKFQEIIFKPLCLSSINSLHLKKFSLFLKANNKVYSFKAINKFTHDLVENLLIPLYNNPNLDKEHLVELIIRYKDIIVAFIKISNINEPTVTNIDIKNNDD